MASHFIRDEIRTAVREEVSRILGQDQLPSTSGTQLEPSRRSTTDRDRTSSSSSTDRTLSFEEFYKKREDERRDGFKPPKKKVKKSNSTPVVAKKSKNVEIKVGRVAQTDGVIKVRRGKIQITTVSSSANKEEITQKAVMKHASFDQSFDESLKYVLLYPDFREVIHIPGTKDMFTLDAYKNALGKEFKRLTFYLIPLDEYKSDAESDSESLTTDEHLCRYGFSGGCNHTNTAESPALVIDEDDDEKMDKCPWDPIELNLTSAELTGKLHSFFSLL